MGPGRNGQGEELQLFVQAMDGMLTIPDLLNADNENIRSIIAQDSYMAKNQETMDAAQEEDKLEDLFRKGVRSSEAAQESLRKTIETLQVVAAVQRDRENDELKAGLTAPSRSSGLATGSGRNASRASARDREKDRERGP